MIRQQKERLGGCSGVESLTVRLPVSLVDFGITAEALSTLNGELKTDRPASVTEVVRELQVNSRALQYWKNNR